MTANNKSIQAAEEAAQQACEKIIKGHYALIETDIVREYVQKGFLAGVSYQSKEGEGWISVKDKMPGTGFNDDAYVLAYGCKFGDVERAIASYCVVASWDGEHWENSYDRKIEDNPDFWVVTHWMPLPSPPIK